MIYIVGSGPTSISAAKLIIDKGLKVTILDVGYTLEDNISSQLEPLKSQPKSNWDSSFISSFKSKVSVDPKGVQKKLVYGSEYPYRELESFSKIESTNIGNLTPSFARGGYSNVWGSAVMPYTDRDIADWPIKIEDLRKYYNSVLDFMPVTWREDEMLKHFPAFTNKSNQLKSSKQGDYILSKLEKNNSVIKDNNISYTTARLAVDAGSLDKSNCVYCSPCLFGCPKQIIYSTSFTLNDLKKHENFEYLPNMAVTAVNEKDGRVEISGYNIKTKEIFNLSGDKCYLGAGVIPTTQILLNSKSIFNQKVKLKVSEYFLAPVFTMKAFTGVQSEELHTLAQIFFEVLDEEISKHYIHVQLYGYSEIYKMALENMLKILPFKSFIMKQVLGRMMAIQGYIHSDYSSHMEMTLTKEKLLLEGKVNKIGAQVIKKLASKLNSLNRYSDLFIFKPMLQVGLPGEGRHFGASFPMSESPGDFQSDLLGRPFGSKNIHIIDSSVFPTIPAPTITFTAMANAQRIADLSL